MAERALRDTEKAQRMAEEAGWQPGQYWSLEVEEETKGKSQERGLCRRQMELLKKAGKAPRCVYVYCQRSPEVEPQRNAAGLKKDCQDRRDCQRLTIGKPNPKTDR